MNQSTPYYMVNLCPSNEKNTYYSVDLEYTKDKCPDPNIITSPQVVSYNVDLKFMKLNTFYSFAFLRSAEFNKVNISINFDGNIADRELEQIGRFNTTKRRTSYGDLYGYAYGENDKLQVISSSLQQPCNETSL
eukprot:TRINITY_DN17517_c0_g1_i1.p1 TRINITY_DN17517_c0_g1~~TRINITY_DN17517_c0_g1_i1.p1  ORF type:complete len:134 (+),score=21.03 TRINITY_DN17517_c0_g1_i1:212-613(+)